MMWERACFRVTSGEACGLLVMLMNSMSSGVELRGATLAISFASCPVSMLIECDLVAIVLASRMRMDYIRKKRPSERNHVVMTGVRGGTSLGNTDDKLGGTGIT
jgi:hypothetical protein